MFAGRRKNRPVELGPYPLETLPRDQAIVAAAWNPLVEPLQLRGEVVHSEVTRLPQAIPQYDLGHMARRAEFEQAAARLGGLHLGGDALHGVGVTAVMARAQATARALA